MKSLKTITLYAICALALFASSLYSQTDGTYKGDQNSAIIISEAPTAEELTKEFTLVTEGKHELFAVLSKITSKKDKAVPALS